ncbi:NAD(P)H-dependent oxidoreductase [Terasakiella sp. A23]|uniref:NAD(P)H-dependent oxidoreductase n=1 Tax=Terasakiella sp. FCG-A23 TaxID=3080561 RepID=UPI00295311DA|nr:NAD(P)H-dependent oxidoreductase [Terasakiella sp. A23]MDV7341045.1 NAD(P)H-dependent oxidoreductase [Terasakiella sp. A23]
MAKILILYAHPRDDRSEVNHVMAKAARTLPNVTVVDLYGEYPGFDIDVAREQQRLIDHNVIIFQHPVYWYSTPAILKEWQDLVLKYGFAFGPEGTALQGKYFLNAATAGAAHDHYSKGGVLGNELIDFFKPFEYMARLCHMTYLPPFSIYRAGHVVDDGELDFYVEEYRRLLVALCDGRLDLEKAQTLTRINDDLDQLIIKPKKD